MPGFIFTVPQGHCAIIERFGKFARIANAGLRFRIPILEQVKQMSSWGPIATQKNAYFIELTEQQSDTAKRTAHTKDNVTVEVDASVYWRILDPQSSVYEVDVLPHSLHDTALNSLRSFIGQLQLDEVLAERQTLNDRIASQLSEISSRWGVQINRVEIQTLETNDDTAKVMQKQMEAERISRATAAKAEGEAVARVRIAEAKRKSVLLEADGRAKAIKMTGEAELEYLNLLKTAVGEESATQILLAEKMLDGYTKISQGEGSKVFIPNSVKGIMLDSSSTS